MTKILAIFLMMPMLAFGLSYHCPTDGVMRDEAALDKTYEASETVFLANVTIEYHDTSGAPRWRYSLITPVLKGSVESEGYLEYGAGPCNFIEVTEKGVYLVFWKKANDPISNKNAKLTVYGGSQVIEEWVLKWAKEKTHNKRL